MHLVHLSIVSHLDPLLAFNASTSKHFSVFIQVSDAHFLENTEVIWLDVG